MDGEKNPFDTRFCELFDLEYPIAAFSHCPDTIYEVCNAGGLGILGLQGMGMGAGASGVGPSAAQKKDPVEELNQALRLITSKTSRPFGIDLLLPTELPAGIREMTGRDVLKLIPEDHKRFVERLRTERGMPEFLDKVAGGLMETFNMDVIRKMLQVAYDYKVPVFAAALGSPPETIAELHGHGVKVISLVGKVKHARRVIEAGADLIVAQGYDAGGHTGEIGTFSLVPQVVDAVKGYAPHIPVLAAGGIMDGRGLAASLALGADGIWTGTIWQTSLEHHLRMPMKQKILSSTQDDTLRQRYMTGKPCRVIRNSYIDEWQKPDAPKPLGMPLQMIVGGGLNAAAEEAEVWDYAVAIAGQGTGLVKRLRSCREIMMDYVEGALETMERFQFE
jgi:NAD(P)H-dependent flavin oxidoreductase YrpB (nitropropane dioxygenase family)